MSKEYTFLFSKISETICEIEKLKDMLIEAQKEAEELYIEGDE